MVLRMVLTLATLVTLCLLYHIIYYLLITIQLLLLCDPPFSCLHCSPLGAVPKKDGTHRIILDLSSPKNCSVNAGIDHDEFSVKIFFV